ncbi:hypothetical protein F5X68DRAFT_2480 [Plectosphaerella plurivora]|uniref:Uncharacterized protein n=1 Tax=Plectosphaerella plurivora TaxID=936078 RepID=A0A9P8VKC7_9PEZI|nr:hypothetical protein F5X68DRAFT_2480 [Plectosphaerella plurivora]
MHGGAARGPSRHSHSLPDADVLLLFLLLCFALPCLAAHAPRSPCSWSLISYYSVTSASSFPARSLALPFFFSCFSYFFFLPFPPSHTLSCFTIIRQPHRSPHNAFQGCYLTAAPPRLDSNRLRDSGTLRSSPGIRRLEYSDQHQPCKTHTVVSVSISINASTDRSPSRASSQPARPAARHHRQEALPHQQETSRRHCQAAPTTSSAVEAAASFGQPASNNTTRLAQAFS